MSFIFVIILLVTFCIGFSLGQASVYKKMDDERSLKDIYKSEEYSND